MKRLPALFLLLLWLGPQCLPAQSDHARPKVGLVLSGGGAKGFAHIGVLKVLERAGIRPDYITGTSMGSIVGGLYALGYPADTLERIAVEQDWNRILTDDIPLEEVLFEEKNYFKNQHIELPIDSTGVRTPEGLIQGQEIERLLSRLTLPAYRVNDFDSLPTPFRCMAVDLYYGTPCELSEGSLGRAIRSSMAIPTVFTPVRQDTLFLVDGGLIRNFPVQEARAMGADIIIGAHSGPRLTPREDLEGVSAILGQTLFLGSLADSEKQFEDVDLYIEPDIAPYGTSDFASAQDIITRGEKAALDLLPQLERLADSLDRLGPPPPKPPYPVVDSVFIDEVIVLGNSIYSDTEILEQAGIGPRQWITPDRLDQAVTTLFGTNHFTKITYTLLRDRDRTVLRLESVEKPNILVKGTLSYDSYHEVGIGVNLTLRNFLMPASRLMLVAKVANNHRYRIEFLKYIDEAQTRWFHTGIQFNVDRLPIIQEGRTTSEYRTADTPLDLWVYQRSGANLRFGLGLRFERLALSPTISESPLFDRLRYLNANYLASIDFNNLDRNIMPTRGNLISLEGGWVSSLSGRLTGPQPGLEDELNSLTSFDPYPRLSFRSEHFMPTGPRGSVVARPFAGLILTDQPLLSDFYALGAPVAVSRRSMPLFGLKANEVLVQTVLGTSLGYQYFPFENVLLAVDLSASFSGTPDFLEAQLLNLEDFFLGGGITAGYNSLIGPISLTLMMPFTEASYISPGLNAFLNFGYRF